MKFQTITFVRSKNTSLKYQRFTTLGSKDIGIWKSEFVEKDSIPVQNIYLKFWIFLYITSNYLAKSDVKTDYAGVILYIRE